MVLSFLQTQALLSAIKPTPPLSFWTKNPALLAFKGKTWILFCAACLPLAQNDTVASFFSFKSGLTLPASGRNFPGPPL
jgi:hypothetical protein